MRDVLKISNQFFINHASIEYETIQITDRFACLNFSNERNKLYNCKKIHLQKAEIIQVLKCVLPDASDSVGIQQPRDNEAKS